MSEAVAILGGGIDMAFDYDIVMPGVEPQLRRPLRGKFKNGEELRRFTSMLIDNACKRFEGNYV